MQNRLKHFIYAAQQRSMFLLTLRICYVNSLVWLNEICARWHSPSSPLVSSNHTSSSFPRPSFSRRIGRLEIYLATSFPFLSITDPLLGMDKKYTDFIVDEARCYLLTGVVIGVLERFQRRDARFSTNSLRIKKANIKVIIEQLLLAYIMLLLPTMSISH